MASSKCVSSYVSYSILVQWDEICVWPPQLEINSVWLTKRVYKNCHRLPFYASNALSQFIIILLPRKINEVFRTSEIEMHTDVLGHENKMKLPSDTCISAPGHTVPPLNISHYPFVGFVFNVRTRVTTIGTTTTELRFESHDPKRGWLFAIQNVIMQHSGFGLFVQFIPMF